MYYIKISKNASVKNLNKDKLDFFKDKKISHLHTWNFNNSEYKLFGYINGNAGSENKYDLPPPVDNILYFNDLYICKYSSNEIIDLHLTDYNHFYNSLFGGFEDIFDDEDIVSEELSEHTSDRDFIDDENITENDLSSDEYDLSDSNEEDLELNITDISFTDSVDENSDNELEEDDDNNNITTTEDNNIKGCEEVISSIEITLSCSDDDDDDDDDDIDDNNNINII